jgi:hypothetical protein
MRWVPVGPPPAVVDPGLAAHKPAGQPQIRKADHVIRVQVSEEDAIYSLPGHLDLIEPLESASACVKNELLPTRLDEGARPERFITAGGILCPRGKL